jgi:pyruvate kinase
MNRISAATVTEPAELERLLDQLLELRTEMVELEASRATQLAAVHSRYRQSAANLLHYVALRRHDLRPLQEHLAARGLSSLGRSEPDVLANLDAVIAMLRRATGRGAAAPDESSGASELRPRRGAVLLEKNTEMLLGPRPAERPVRIMVTMPSEAAHDYTLVHGLVEAGMDCMRINCAHDDAATWERIIAHLRRAEQATNRRCRVMMDLGGPKLRTGAVAPGAGVVKYKPLRDPLGRVVAPARIWLTDRAAPTAPPTEADAVVPLPADFLALLEQGMRIAFRDARDSRRKMKVVERAVNGAWAEAFETAYLVAGTLLETETRTATKSGRMRPKRRSTRLGALPPCEEGIVVECGDTLVLTRAPLPGRAATRDSQGRLLSPARIGCTLPEIFDDVQPGERLFIDDGKIGGVIRSVEAEQIRIQITQARTGGARLRGDKGINLPDSTLRLSALTAKDLADLPFVVAHADLVGYSFVRTPDDVVELEQRLAELKGSHVGMVLKIETRQAFDHLPSLLLATMSFPCDGVMIARGDLAVECGYERLAEIQEEILWMCEAAHLPVIWATQVLESLAKEGMPSRAEISDASIGGRAECVMLNKGPHIVKAVRVLDDILRRMQAHQSKKRSMLRPLRVATGFGE